MAYAINRVMSVIGKGVVMRKRHSLVYHVSLFILAQLTLLTVLGLWIYWYVSNYIIFQKVGQRISPTIIAGRTGYFALVTGLVLLLLITILMSMLFKYLYGQVSLHRLYDNFIANVSHELKSPLSSIQLHLETLSMRQMSVVQQRDFLSMILGDVGRLNVLVDTILEISGLEQKRDLYRYSVHPMDSVIDRLVNRTRELFALSEDAIRISGEAHCVCVLDWEALQTVLNNLVDNAIKYNPQKADILIRLSATKRWFIMEIRDNGIGIPVREQKMIFNKFYRVSGRDSPCIKGVGLGLFRVREIVRAHGGKVFVQSCGEGCGTTFRIDLPVYREVKRRFTRKLLRITNRRRMEDGYGGK